MTPRRAERRAVGALVLATLLWGGTFVAIRDSVADVPAALLVGLRFALAGLVFAGVLAARGHRLTRDEWRGGMLSGLLMAGGFFLQAEALRFTSAGTSAFLTCAGTLLAAFWAWPLLGQRPGPRLLLAIAIAMAGAALLTLRGGLGLGRGEALTLLGAALFALQIVAVSRYVRGSDAVALVCVQSLVAAAATLPFAGRVSGAHALFTGDNLGRFVYLAVAGSTVAPYLQVYAQRTLSAGRVGLLFALEPVFALLFAITLGAERFDSRWWWGAALILGAVVLMEARGSDAAGTHVPPEPH